jgi:Ca2+-transporting ATPase
MAATALGVEAWGVNARAVPWQTVVFTVLCLSQLGHAMAIRSERESLFTQGLLSNKPLLGAVALTVLLQMAVVYVPALNRLFHTEPLSAGALALAVGASLTVFVAVELEKWWGRHDRGRTVRAEA